MGLDFGLGEVKAGKHRPGQGHVSEFSVRPAFREAGHGGVAQFAAVSAASGGLLVNPPVGKMGFAAQRVDDLAVSFHETEVAVSEVGRNAEVEVLALPVVLHVGLRDTGMDHRVSVRHWVKRASCQRQGSS